MSDVSIRYTSKSRQDNTENSQIPSRNKLATSANEQMSKRWKRVATVSTKSIRNDI